MYYHRILGLKQYLTFSICFWSKYFEDRVANELNVAVFFCLGYEIFGLMYVRRSEFIQ